jgi:hypothetical protein
VQVDSRELTGDEVIEALAEGAPPMGAVAAGTTANHVASVHDATDRGDDADTAFLEAPGLAVL